ncbi:MAG: MFS transporter [Deltaproteobacteria bacterium]|nr:MFS transporter [Deltaproteobacteria bacterium]
MTMKTFKIYRLAILSIIAVLYFFVCLHRMSPTVIARDLMISLSTDAVTLGFIASAYFYLYSAMQPVVGYLSDTTGPRKVMALLFFISAVGAVIFGLAPNAPVAFLGRLLIGAGLAGVFIPALKIFSHWYPLNQFASLTGLMITIGGLAGLAAALPLTYLIVLLGWRGSFIAMGLLSAFLAVLTWIIVRDTPEDKGWPACNAEYISVPAAGEKHPLSRRLATVFSNLDFCLLFSATFLIYGSSLSFQGLWAVPYLMDVFGLDRVRAGGILMALPLGFAIGGSTAGFLIDRLNLDRKKSFLGALVLGIILWLVLIFLKEKTHLTIVLPLFFFFGLAGGGSLPISFAITRDLFPSWLMGTATGMMNTAGFLGSVIYMPFTGYVLSHSVSARSGSFSFDDYRKLFIVFLLSYAVAFIALTRLSKHKNAPAS